MFPGTDIPIELGAQWLFGADTNPVANLTSNFWVPRAEFGRELGGVASLPSPWTSGAQPLPINSFYVDDNTTLAGNEAMVLGSLQTMVEDMAAAINTSTSSAILLSSPVFTIHVGELNATVVTGNATEYRSQYVVCTVPLGVLQEGGVAFQPPLPPPTSQALARLEIATTNPVHLLFDQAFWDSRAEAVELGTSPPGGWVAFLSLLTFTGRPILVALPGTQASLEVEQQTDAKVIESVMSALRATYGTAVPDGPTSYVVTRWGLNPYARNTHFTYGTQGSPADVLTLSEPVSGTLMFAGDSTNAKFPSTLHGAYLSGVAQAARIEQALQLPSTDNDQCLAQCYSSGYRV